MADDTRNNRRLIIISGLSGAGKSLALNALEDLDYFCIDNLPLKLFKQFAGLLTDSKNNFPSHVGIGIDARSPADELFSLPDSIAALRRQGVNVDVVFMEASKNVLTTRFGETRRKHPLSSGELSLTDAIDEERAVMQGLSDLADLRIDTSRTNVHELRNIVRERLANRPLGMLSLQFISFGFKHGVPGDADFLFDVRCMPNPYWDESLRDQTGRDKAVIDFLSSQPVVNEMGGDIKVFLDRWFLQFEAENRSYLCVAIGCTGGRHRSVYFVDMLSDYFKSKGKHVISRHRDL